MAEHYQDIIGRGGNVVGQRLVSDAALTTSGIRKHLLLKRMTPAEAHAWYRAFQRAANTNTPVVADRNALFAWLRWAEMDGEVDMSSEDIQGLKSVWVAMGMTQARADAILVPYEAGTDPA
jgi:hypothetical protein